MYNIHVEIKQLLRKKNRVEMFMRILRNLSPPATNTSQVKHWRKEGQE